MDSSSEVRRWLMISSDTSLGGGGENNSDRSTHSGAAAGSAERPFQNNIPGSVNTRDPRQSLGAGGSNASFGSTTPQSPAKGQWGKRTTYVKPPSLDEDPLTVRGIDTDLDASALRGLRLMDGHASPFGPVWEAVLDTTERVRVFGLRAAAAEDNTPLLSSLLDTLRAQVLLSHPVLARPIGVVRQMPSNSGGDDDGDNRPWVGLVYRVDEDEEASLGIAVRTVLEASRFLEAVVAEYPYRVGAIAPASFLGEGGTEVACWGLEGAVDDLWLNGESPFVAPELASGETMQATEASEVFGLARWAADVLSARDAMVDFLDSCLAEDAEARPSLVHTAYTILAELEHPSEGWTSVHYACQVDDDVMLASFLEAKGDVDLASSPDVESDVEAQVLIEIAVANRAVRCVTRLIAGGCDTSFVAMRAAIQVGSLAVIDALMESGMALSPHDVAAAPSDELFNALLERYTGSPVEVYQGLEFEMTMTAPRLALLSRRGLSLRLPTLTKEDLRRQFEEAETMVPAGSHPLDAGSHNVGEGSVASNSKTATFGVGDEQGGDANVSVDIPEWVHTFPRSDFSSSKPIGEGGFGTVYKAVLHGTAVAVKTVNVPSRRAALSFVSEVAAHARIRHLHVLPMLGLMVDETSGKIGIVSELMKGGDLATKLMEARLGRTSFALLDRARVLGEVAEGIAYLHTQGLIHRDIKPANILLTAAGEAKIGDLGLASVEGGREGRTRKYAASEILLKTARSSFASDVYSFALTVYETMTLAQLAHGSDREGRETEAPWQVQDDAPEPITGPWWVAMLMASLETEPGTRPTMVKWLQVWEAVAAVGDAAAGTFISLVALEKWDDAMAVDAATDGDVELPTASVLRLAVDGSAPSEVVIECLDRGCDPNQVFSDGLTPLMWSARGGDVAVVAALLGAGADVNAATDEDWTAIMFAAESGSFAAVSALAGAGAAVNASHVGGQTALMVAADAGHLAVVEVLVEAGADVDAGWDRNETALMIAAKNGHASVVSALLAAGARFSSSKKREDSALMRGAKFGHVDVVGALLAAGANPNKVRKDGWTPLMLASEFGHLGVAKALMDAGADVNATAADGGTALMAAVNRGHGDVVGLLLAAGADVNVAKHTSGMTALMYGAREGRTEVVKALVDSKATVGARMSNQWTALMTASLHGRLGVVSVLLDAGANVNATEPAGKTALMLAASSGHVGVVQALIGAGAKVNAARTDGETALVIATKRGHTNVVRSLVAEAGANVNATDERGESALLIAARSGFGSIVEVLVDVGADVNSATDAGVVDGATALMQAAMQGHINVVECLLKAGVDVNAARSNGWTPLMAGAMHGHVEVVDALVAAGANVNAAKDDDWTALMSAAANGHVTAVAALLEAGAEVNVAEHGGVTPLMAAAANGHTEVVGALVDAGADVGAEKDDGATALVIAQSAGRTAVVDLLQ